MTDFIILFACWFALIFSAVGFVWGIYLMYLEYLTHKYTSKTDLQALRQAARYADDAPYREHY